MVGMTFISGMTSAMSGSSITFRRSTSVAAQNGSVRRRNGGHGSGTYTLHGQTTGVKAAN
jgi:hypothetical protein